MKGRSNSLVAAGLLILGGLDGIFAAKPSPACGSASKLVTSGSVNTPLTMTVNGKSRNYFVKLPDNYDSSHPYRLIYTLHALGGTASQVIAGTNGYLPWYGIPPLANDNISAIYVAPNGLDNGWANNGGEDITFISQINDVLDHDLCIDRDLRFSTGFSYGGAMSYAIACALAKDFRAVAALSGNPQISGCAGGNDPIAYYGQHGVSDNVLPITAAHQMRDRFVKNNGCTGPQNAPEPAAGSGTHIKTKYTGCQADYPVVWVAFDGPHTPTPMDKGASQTFSNTETWEFFSQFT
ncbi:Uncharacterized protein BP5553_08418 [Venustampulla echinocandica]|uniref:feruloyl esterase n=1 Tax=Venustampulla echinocandica TaxID=2656787 RepID=A0A370TE58_9HELO|nr:Uncharacterized protein BP5553_08418 [Venustampulla echinocandica]RDL32979.1 Uncharacterized protein BP5553_08418 [Venustampulla echinocandica]